MSTKRNETPIVKEVLEYCQLVLKSKMFVWRNNTQGTYNAKRGAYFFHGLAGVPDIIGMTSTGKFIGIEVKDPNNKGGKFKDGRSDSQVQFYENCIARNGICLCVTGVTHLQKELERIGL